MGCQASASVDVFQTGLGKRFAHAVHVEPELAFGEARALSASLASRSSAASATACATQRARQRRHRPLQHVTGIHERSGAHHRDIHRAQVALIVPLALMARENTGKFIA
jgi:hypothetical protein